MMLVVGVGVLVGVLVGVGVLVTSISRTYLLV